MNGTISHSRTGRTLISFGLLPALLAGILSGGAAQAEDNAALKGPGDAAFYEPPALIRPGRHGELIWAAEIGTSVPGARAWKLLYWSTTLDDKPVPVSGILVAPNGEAPAHSRPVVTWGHGTTGLPRNCAPSMVSDPARDALFYFLPNSPADFDIGVPGLSQMIAAGYVVVATDYNGLGAPGIHHYLIGQTEARNVLDAAIAAQEMAESAAGPQAVVIGWSEGGQAAVWAAELADYAGDNTHVLGAVALAPVNALAQIKSFGRMAAAGQKPPKVSAVELAMAWYAMTIVDPRLKLSDVLTPDGLAVFTEALKAGQCNHHMSDSFAYAASYNRGPLTLDEPTNQEAWHKRYEENSLGNMPAKVPVAVYQGDDDIAVDPAATRAYVNKACASGATLAYTHYAGTDHIRLAARAQADFMAWIADRFAGKAAPSTCR